MSTRRTLAPELLANMLSPSPNDGIYWLLKLEWNDGVYSDVLRLALHVENITSSGEIYVAGAFAIAPPDEDTQDVSMLRIVVQDADQAVRIGLRQLDPRYPATATVKPVLMSNPDTLALAAWSGPIRNVKIGRVAIAGSVETFPVMVNQPLVEPTMSPAWGFKALRSRG